MHPGNGTFPPEPASRGVGVGLLALLMRAALATRGKKHA
jgi:hypothetical protein